MIIYDSNRRQVRLGPEIGGGGEATVYQLVHQPDLLAKIYKGSPRLDYQQKLVWMQANPPQNPTQALGHASIAWPQALLYDAAGRLAGYLMPYIHQAVSILEAFNPRYRAQALPGFNRRYLHRTAQNLANALEALHLYGYVVGDLNESNIMVTPSALVTIIDADSFQIKVEQGGGTHIYRCPVGKPEYTPPELQGRSFVENDRLPEHDRFGLGVLIFQLLLNGSHPFRAQWLGPGEPPAIEERIRLGCFPYLETPPCPVSPPRHAPSLNILYPKLAHLFRQCFAEGHYQPRRRPSPRVWAEVLAEAEEALMQCQAGHYFSKHLRACPECTHRDLERSVISIGSLADPVDSPPIAAPPARPIVATPVTSPAPAQLPPPPAPIFKTKPAANQAWLGWTAGLVMVIILTGIILALLDMLRSNGVVIEPSSTPLPTYTPTESRTIPSLMTPLPAPTSALPGDSAPSVDSALSPDGAPAPPPTDTPALLLTNTPALIPTDTPQPAPGQTPTIPPPAPADNTGKPRIFIILPQGDFYNQGDKIQVVLAIQDSDGVGNVLWWVTDAATADVVLRDSRWCNHQVECVVTEEVSDLSRGVFNIFVAAFDKQQNSVIEEAQISVR